MSENDGDEALERRLRTHYDRTGLAPEKLERLVAMGRDGATGGDTGSRYPTPPGARSFGPLARTVALATLLLAVALLMHASGSATERIERTLREAAMNHATRFEPEFHGESISALDTDMTLLPFSLAPSERVGADEVEVVGSRYCSLAGHLAAHVKLRDVESGQPLSLFVAALSPELERMHGRSDDVDGVDIELWKEDGLFYALARHR